METSSKYSDKLNGLILMDRAGLPVLPFLILDKKMNIEKQLRIFLKDMASQKFCTRIDNLNSKMGQESIIDATINNDLAKIEKLVKDNTVFVSHPGNIYKNFHSVNIMKDYGEIILEIIGPGFITPDMDKRGIVHEQYTFSDNFEQLSHTVLVDQDQYQSHIQLKIGKDLGKHKEHDSFLLKHTDYVPLSETEVAYVKHVYPQVDAVAHKMGYDKFVASLSFIELDGESKPIFWDIFGINR